MPVEGVWLVDALGQTGCLHGHASSISKKTAEFLCAPNFTSCCPLFFYQFVSLFFFAKWTNWSKHYFGAGTDPISFVWFLNSWPFAITHGLNPFISKYIWFPVGFNMTWATSIPLLALIRGPITTLGGPVLSYNILALMAPALLAWTTYLFLLELTSDALAALIGGYLFGFSTYEINTMMGALNLDMLFLLPLALCLCVKRMREKISRGKFVVYLSLLVIAQLGISTEILATAAMFGTFLWLILLLSSSRAALLRLAGDIALCIPVSAMLTAPFLYYLVMGLADTPAVINSPYFASADLLSFVLPCTQLVSVSQIVPLIGGSLARLAPNWSPLLCLAPLIGLSLFVWADRGGRVCLNTVSLSKCLTLNGSPSNFDVRFFA